MDLPEVVGTHDPGAGDRQELRVLSASVLESVDGTPGDAESIAHTDLDGAAMVELTTVAPEFGVDRIVIAPLAKLRVINAR